MQFAVLDVRGARREQERERAFETAGGGQIGDVERGDEVR
jgi:hypothetical protein